MKLAFTASARPEAQEALRRLRHIYGEVGEAEADVIVALGGDGHMLDTLRRRLKDKKPVYGMNRGTVGFLMNEYNEDGLAERLGKRGAGEDPAAGGALRDARRARSIVERAFNEVSLLRQTAQSARLRILVDGAERMAELLCDGVMVATPGGLDRLQLLRARPDPADQFAAAGADARSARSARAAGAARCCRTRAHVRFEVLEAGTAHGQRRGRQSGDARRRRRRYPRRYRRGADASVRRQAMRSTSASCASNSTSESVNGLFTTSGDAAPMMQAQR